MSILWVLQDNIYKETGYLKLVEGLRRLERNVMIVTPVPMTNILLASGYITDRDITEEDGILIEHDGPILCFGSLALRRIAIAQNLKPGKIGEGVLTYADWRDGLGAGNILNPDVEIGTVKSFFGYQPENDVFVRPVEDTKSLAGTIMTPHDFVDWVASYSIVDPDGITYALNKDTEIMLSSIKQIYNECRVFVLDGKVITASMYKFGNKVRYSDVVDDRYVEFAQRMVDKYSPADGFVIDIADTPDGLKVIELNDFNCAGFYHCDVMKIIAAIEDFYDVS